MKKSHKWNKVPSVHARCPHCGWWYIYQWANEMGNIIRWCKECGKAFELGRQR